MSVDEARNTPRLNYRLLAEKNTEIDELGLQNSILKEHLELIKSQLNSDITREEIMNQVSVTVTCVQKISTRCRIFLVYMMENFAGGLIIYLTWHTVFVKSGFQ